MARISNFVDVPGFIREDWENGTSMSASEETASQKVIGQHGDSIACGGLFVFYLGNGCN